MELTECWRPYPDFVGPVMPPMIAWMLSERGKGHYWEREQWWLNDASDLPPHSAAPEHAGAQAADQMKTDGGGLEGVGPV